ncbi:MAG: GerMN domain-containing protein [Clostridia bacterium]|nr:GerMN domain-containing protein [Clostridia bacterium]
MKKSAYLIILIFIAFLALLLWRQGLQPGHGLDPATGRSALISSGGMDAITVYYLSNDGQFLLPLSFKIAPTGEPARVAMEKLLAGSPVAAALAPLPEETKLLDLYSADDILYIELTADFLRLNEVETKLAAQAVAATVLPLTTCGQMRILTRDNTAAAKDANAVAESDIIGMPYLNLLSASRKLMTEADFAPATYMSAVFYLPEAGNDYLIPLTLLLSLDEAGEDRQLAVAQAAVQALLTTPSCGGLTALPLSGINWQGLVIRDGVAYCDFDQSLLQSYGARAEKLFLRCLTQTLCAVDGIEAVQLTVAGEAADATASGINISQPLRAEQPPNLVESKAK